MHDNYDLRQEQLNKSSLLSSKKFLGTLLEIFSAHVVSCNFYQSEVSPPHRLPEGKDETEKGRAGSDGKEEKMGASLLLLPLAVVPCVLQYPQSPCNIKETSVEERGLRSAL